MNSQQLIITVGVILVVSVVVFLIYSSMNKKSNKMQHLKTITSDVADEVIVDDSGQQYYIGDDTISTVDSSGTWTTIGDDGTVTVQDPYGNYSTTEPDGTSIITDPSGVSTVLNPNDDQAFIVCTDGSIVTSADDCPVSTTPTDPYTPIPIQTYSCPDGTIVSDISTCPVVTIDPVTGIIDPSSGTVVTDPTSIVTDPVTGLPVVTDPVVGIIDPGLVIDPVTGVSTKVKCDKRQYYDVNSKQCMSLVGVKGDCTTHAMCATKICIDNKCYGQYYNSKKNCTTDDQCYPFTCGVVSKKCQSNTKEVAHIMKDITINITKLKQLVTSQYKGAVNRARSTGSIDALTLLFNYDNYDSYSGSVRQLVKMIEQRLNVIKKIDPNLPIPVVLPPIKSYIKPVVNPCPKNQKLNETRDACIATSSNAPTIQDGKKCPAEGCGDNICGSALIKPVCGSPTYIVKLYDKELNKSLAGLQNILKQEIRMKELMPGGFKVINTTYKDYSQSLQDYKVKYPDMWISKIKELHKLYPETTKTKVISKTPNPYELTKNDYSKYLK